MRKRNRWWRGCPFRQFRRSGPCCQAPFFNAGVVTMRFRGVVAGLALFVACAAGASTFFPTREDIEQWTPAQKQQFAGFGDPLARSQVQLGNELATGGKSVRIGDMVFMLDDLQVKGSFCPDIADWPEGKVYYEFAKNVKANQRAVWVRGASEWSRVANVQFIERANTPGDVHVPPDYCLCGEDESISSDEPGYVYIQPGDGNWTVAGYGPGCRKMCLHDWTCPVVMHEIGHVLRLVDEHRRSDRDEHLCIDWDHVIDDKACREYLEKIEGTINYSPYDFDSIMHYESRVCSRIGEPILIPYESSECGPPPTECYPCPPESEKWIDVMGKGDFLSYYDREAMAERYGPGPEAGDDKYEPNNHDFTAYDLSGYEGKLLSEISGKGILHDPDFYRIQPGGGKVEVTVECTFLPEDSDATPDLHVYGPDGQPRDCTSVARPDYAKVTCTLCPGEVLFVEVAGPRNHIPYDLRWTKRSLPGVCCPGAVGSSRSLHPSSMHFGDLLVLLSSAAVLLLSRSLSLVRRLRRQGHSTS